MTTKLNHLAIIMDGNGRWAQSRGLLRGSGHKAGIRSVNRIMQGCHRHDIEHLTLFAFSSENWRRPKTEVGFLMDLFVTTIGKEISELVKNNVCLRFIGDVSAFDKRLQDSINDAVAKTADNTGLKLNLAVNYGGRWDIAQAAARIAAEVKVGQLEPADISAEKFADYVSMADMPDPDLLIRTGGEYRISNFLNWQLAYTELYFTECLCGLFCPCSL